jgi:serine/threonine-protein kinase
MSHDAFVGVVLDGKYRLDAVLGEGTSGGVYRGVALATGRPVAVKMLHPEWLGHEESRRRFEREARTLAALRHPNVIDVIEFGSFEKALYLVMELLEGRTLGAQIEVHGPPPLDVGLRIADQLLAGLAFAHQHGVLHRDLKSDNVFVAEPLTVKILDFGLAKLDRATWGEASLTAVGSMLGTPGYMPPEQALGGKADPRSDVYVAGVILFEILTGQWPFHAEDIPGMIRAHALDPVPPLASVRPDVAWPPHLEAVVRTAMAKKPSDRYEDAATMRRALRAPPLRN